MPAPFRRVHGVPAPSLNPAHPALPRDVALRCVAWRGAGLVVSEVMEQENIDLRIEIVKLRAALQDENPVSQERHFTMRAFEMIQTQHDEMRRDLAQVRLAPFPRAAQQLAVGTGAP